MTKDKIDLRIHTIALKIEANYYKNTVDIKHELEEFVKFLSGEELADHWYNLGYKVACEDMLRKLKQMGNKQ